MPVVLSERNGRIAHARQMGRVLGALALVAGFFAAGPANAQDVVSTIQSGDYHVVREGETLSSLAGTYMSDPFQWPKLWSFNPHITNPHWVYPGDIVYVRPKGTVARGTINIDTGKRSNYGLMLPLASYISTEKAPFVGRIVASEKEARMISALDSVWVGFGEEAYTDEERDRISKKKRVEFTASEPKVGDLYAIVRPLGVVEDDDDNVLGHKYMVVGSLRLTEISEKYLENAVVTQSWSEVERGDLLVPYERQLKAVLPVASEQDMVASIMDAVQLGFDFAEHNYVFVDRGANHGMRVGNRFFVYQRWEGMTRDRDDLEKEVPWTRVGQVMILDVRENYSTAIITDSSREIQVGDRLEMYKGY